MRKIKTLLLALLLIPSLMFGQKLSDDFTVSVADPYQVIDAGSKDYITLDNGNIIMLKIRKGVNHLQLFGVEGMKEIARNTYEDFPKYTKKIELIKLKDKIYYIYQAYNKSTKNFSVYSREINTEEASFMEQQELFTTNRKVASSKTNGELKYIKTTGYSVGGVVPGPKFLIEKSFDDSKLMIHYRSNPRDRKDAINYDDIGFFIFDKDMNKIWGQEVKMPYTEAKMNNVAYSVSSKGNALMLIVNNDSKTYEVISVDNSGTTKTNNLGISSEKLVRSIKVKELPSGNFSCAGFYANGIEYKFMGGNFVFNINGLLYFEVSAEGDVVSKNTYDFSENFIKQNLSDHQKKKAEAREAKGKAGIGDLLLLNFVIKKDGSAYFVGERQYMQKAIMSSTYEFRYGNIVMIKVNKDGELKWMKKLPKQQIGVAGIGQMSFAYMEGKDSDYITFVDNPKNIKLDAAGGVPEPHKDGMGGFLTAYKIDHETGDLEKHTICDLKNIEGVRAYQFRTTRIVKSSDGVFLMEIYIKKKKDTMVKFKLNN